MYYICKLAEVIALFPLYLVCNFFKCHDDRSSTILAATQTILLDSILHSDVRIVSSVQCSVLCSISPFFPVNIAVFWKPHLSKNGLLHGETTKTAHKPKRPINFLYDQNGPWQNENGPQLHPKRPTAKSKTAHEPERLTVTEKAIHKVIF